MAQAQVAGMVGPRPGGGEETHQVLRRLLKARLGQGGQPHVLQGQELGSGGEKACLLPTGEDTAAGKLGPPPRLVSTKAGQMPTSNSAVPLLTPQQGTLSYIHTDLHKTVPTSSHLLETAQVHVHTDVGLCSHSSNWRVTLGKGAP